MSGSKHVMLGRLLANVGRLHATRANQYMEQIGLYHGQAIFLLILSEQDGLAHSVLAKQLEISPAAATKVIKRLEEEGYLERRPDPEDERVSRVYLCEKGRVTIDEIHRSFCELDQAMLQGLTDEKLEQLRGFLWQMQVNLRQTQPDPLARSSRSDRQLPDECLSGE